MEHNFHFLQRPINHCEQTQNAQLFIPSGSQSDPRESHFKVVRRILRYLVGTINQSLFYMKNQDFKLVGYYEADYAWDRVEQKSPSRGCHYIGNCLIY